MFVMLQRPNQIRAALIRGLRLLQVPSMVVVIQQTFALAWLSSTGPLPAASSTGESSALWFVDRAGLAQAWQGKHRLLLSSNSQPPSSFAGALTLK
ncbi:hypothetical protein VZT92_022572 [Zoarces viviparus]|uniref:Uncharacterized protein n=1 Tax=Zoarces viviparus TaxID=48416 RepID=A0AAW1EBS2_ZOAVI